MFVLVLCIDTVLIAECSETEQGLVIVTLVWRHNLSSRLGSQVVVSALHLMSNVCYIGVRKQFHLGGGRQRNIPCDAAICVACMNINKVSRENIGRALATPWFLRLCVIVLAPSGPPQATATHA